MKNCSDIIENISCYIDNEMGTNERIEFEEHIASCASCKSELDEITDIVNICNNTDEVELPKNFKGELHQKLIQISEKSDKKGKILFFNSVNFKVLTSIAAVFILFFLLRGLFDSNLIFNNRTSNSATGGSGINASQSKGDVMMKAAAPAIESAADSYAGEQNGTAGKVSFAGTQSESDNGSETGRALSDYRINTQAENPSAAVNDNISVKHTNIVIAVGDPKVQLENVKAIALKYSAVEQSVPTFTEATAKITVTYDKDTDTQELNISLPNEQYTAFIEELKKSYAKSDIQTEAITTEDKNTRYEELLKQLDSLDTRMGDLEKKNDTASQKDYEKLKQEKIGLQNEIDTLRLDSDLIFVKVILKKS